MAFEVILKLDVIYRMLTDEKEFAQFYEGNTTEIKVPFSNKRIKYDSLKRIGVGVSRLGTSQAVAIGAYAFALNSLDKK